MLAVQSIFDDEKVVGLLSGKIGAMRLDRLAEHLSVSEEYLIGVLSEVKEVAIYKGYVISRKRIERLKMRLVEGGLESLPSTPPNPVFAIILEVALKELGLKHGP